MPGSKGSATKAYDCLLICFHLKGCCAHIPIALMPSARCCTHQPLVINHIHDSCVTPPEYCELKAHRQRAVSPGSKHDMHQLAVQGQIIRHSKFHIKTGARVMGPCCATTMHISPQPTIKRQPTFISLLQLQFRHDSALHYLAAKATLCSFITMVDKRKGRIKNS